MYPHQMEQMASQHTDELRAQAHLARRHVQRPGPRNSVGTGRAGRWSRSDCAWLAGLTMPEAAGTGQADRLRHPHGACWWPASARSGSAPGAGGRPRPPSGSRQAWSSPTWRPAPRPRAGRGPAQRAGPGSPGPAVPVPGSVTAQMICPDRRHKISSIRS